MALYKCVSNVYRFIVTVNSHGEGPHRLWMLESVCRRFSSTAHVQEKPLGKWHELPPVPQTAPVIGSWGPEAKCQLGGQPLTAIRWVAKCCPSVPNSLIQKLFRVRQIRQRVVLEKDSSQDSSSNNELKQGGALSRVSGKAVVIPGTILYIPKSVLELDGQDYKNCDKPMPKHQPTAQEKAWLQSLVIHKDAQILVINKPPGLAVQGGSEIKKSLDSLMGDALRFEYLVGPKLVHRLDKETSGAMVLARTRETAVLMHALFRAKTSSALSSASRDDLFSPIARCYLALVIGIPSEPEGRISRAVIKRVMDDGRAEKMCLAEDETVDGAQGAVTDFKVFERTNSGCTWVELRPLTGRKHQLRVHCAEVLGTPVVGDLKYGWKTHRSWKDHIHLQNLETRSLGDGFSTEQLRNVKSLEHSKRAVRGSVVSKDLMLHLHCQSLAIPDPTKFSREKPRKAELPLRFSAPLPPHMALSQELLRRVRS